MATYKHVAADEAIAVDPYTKPMPKRKTIWSQSRFDCDHFVNFCSNWKGTAIIGASIAGTALLLNILVLIWAVAALPKVNGFAIVYTGSDEVVRRIDVAVKLIINIVSTAILLSSSRCTQYLCAPTRKDIDKAHCQGTWLDVGVRSWRNFAATRGWRMWTIIVLLVSSIPIHIIYNSTVVATVAAQDFVAITVDSSFTTGHSWNTSTLLPLWNTSILSPVYNRTAQEELELVAQELQRVVVEKGLTKYGATECSYLYATEFQSRFGNLLIVSPDLNNSNSTGNLSTVAAYTVGRVSSPGISTAYQWWADTSITIPYLQVGAITYSEPYANAAECVVDTNISCSSNDTFVSVNVAECYVQETPEKSMFSINIGFLIAVICANAVKAVSLLLTMRKSFVPLCTTGDAIASFLTEPDTTTSGLGPLSVFHVTKAGITPGARERALTLSSNQYRWLHAPGRSRWWIGTLSLVVPLTIGALCLVWILLGDVDTTSSLVENISHSQWSATIIDFAHTFVGMALAVNCAQLLLSLVYMGVNNLLTSMALAHEYHTYAVRRKPLRVTTPRGQQRSTYFLSLPNKYAIPLAVTWTLLHWLTANQITLLRVDVYDYNRVLIQDRCYTGMAISGDWLIGIMTCAAILLLGFPILGFRKLQKGLPFARTCSLVISAACHCGSDERVDAAFLPLQYGVLKDMEVDGLLCVGFSSRDVEPLMPGLGYASTPYEEANIARNGSISSSIELGPLISMDSDMQNN